MYIFCKIPHEWENIPRYFLYVFYQWNIFKDEKWLEMTHFWLKRSFASWHKQSLTTVFGYNRYNGFKNILARYLIRNGYLIHSTIYLNSHLCENTGIKEGLYCKTLQTICLALLYWEKRIGKPKIIYQCFAIYYVTFLL